MRLYHDRPASLTFDFVKFIIKMFICDKVRGGKDSDNYI